MTQTDNKWIAKYSKVLPKILEGEFEKSLYEACVNNLMDLGNKLRLNNFAYSIRELSRHILHRLAPDDNVRSSIWYELHDPNKPESITRQQRVKYAIQGKLSDSVIHKLNIDVDIVCDELVETINALSKFTHIEVKTFDIEAKDVELFAKDVFSTFNMFVKQITEFRERLHDELINHIDEKLVEEFFCNTLSEIDVLATHYSIDEHSINGIEFISASDDTIECEATGTVSVILQYGSNLDLKKGDGLEIEKSFPFTGRFVYNFENGEIELIENSLIVNTDSFYE